MPSRKKSWQDKFNSRAQPAIEVLEKPFAGLQPGQTLLISTPAELDAQLRQIPYGQTESVANLRQTLAALHRADSTCPLTTSIFLRIVAEVALEQIAHGQPVSDVAPFWRVVEPKSPLAQKLSCGPDWITAQRASELP